MFLIHEYGAVQNLVTIGVSLHAHSAHHQSMDPIRQLIQSQGGAPSPISTPAIKKETNTQSGTPPQGMMQDAHSAPAEASAPQLQTLPATEESSRPMTYFLWILGIGTFVFVLLNLKEVWRKNK